MDRQRREEEIKTRSSKKGHDAEQSILNRVCLLDPVDGLLLFNDVHMIWFGIIHSFHAYFLWSCFLLSLTINMNTRQLALRLEDSKVLGA